MKLTHGQRIRLTSDVQTTYVDGRHEYPGISYADYARLQRPISLRAGTIAVFDHYLCSVPGLCVLTTVTEETPLCGLILGRRETYRVDVPTESIAPCSADLEPTPLRQCVLDPEGLDAHHPFRHDG
jgi:hypothetical protein